MMNKEFCIYRLKTKRCTAQKTEQPLTICPYNNNQEATEDCLAYKIRYGITDNTPHPGQWCWFDMAADFHNKIIKKFKEETEHKNYKSEDDYMYCYCRPLTEQELIANGLKEENSSMKPMPDFWTINHREKENTMQEQISEEMADKLLSVVEDKEIIKALWKKSSYIKESALERAERELSGLISHFIANDKIIKKLEKIGTLFYTAIEEKDKEIKTLKNNQKTS